MIEKQRIKEYQDVVYIGLNPVRSNFGKDIDKAVGKTIDDNQGWVLDHFKVIQWNEIKLFLMGFVLPTIFISIYVVLIYFAYVWCNINLIVSIVIYILSLFLVWVFYIFYFSQQDRNENYNQVTEKTSNFKNSFKFRRRKGKRCFFTLLIYLCLTVFLWDFVIIVGTKF